jgi:hypothetical protein
LNMADDWEDNDWESDNFKPVIPAATKPSGPTAAAIIAPAAELDLSKFQEEDADLEKEEKKHFVPQSQVSTPILACTCMHLHGQVTCSCSPVSLSLS